MSILVPGQVLLHPYVVAIFSSIGCRQQEGIKQMSVSELADILQDPTQTSQVQLVDVREQVEERVANVPQFQLKPLSRCASNVCRLWVQRLPS